MASTYKIIEKNVAEIDFQIPVEEFREGIDYAFKKNRKRFQVPGFRPGKAPLNIVTKYYGEGVLYDDAIEFVADKAYAAALEEHNLSPVSRPQIEEITEIGMDKGVKFLLRVTLKPEVTLGKYTGLGIKKEKFKLIPEMIDEELYRLQERNSRMVPVEDREVQDGDIANIDYEGFLDDVAFDGGTANNYDLRIGSGTFIPGFEDQVIGKSKGDEFDVNVKFPEEYHNDELKGKDVVFKVKLNEIKVKELPELNDEFAQDISEFDTLDEYKSDLKEKLTKDGEVKAENDFLDKVIQTVTDNAQVDIPDVMVEHEIEHTIQEQAYTMERQGLEFERYLQYMGQDLDSYKETIKPGTVKKIKTNLVLEAIGKELNFDLSDDDLEAEYGKIAEQYGMEIEKVKEQFSGNDSFVRENALYNKTIEYLKDNADAAKSSSSTGKKKTKSSDEVQEKEAEKVKKGKKEADKKDSVKKEPVKKESVDKESDKEETKKKEPDKKESDKKENKKKEQAKNESVKNEALKNETVKKETVKKEKEKEGR